MRKKRNRVIACVLVLVLLTALLSGCAKQENRTTVETNVPQEAFPTAEQSPNATATPTEEVVSTGYKVYSQGSSLLMSDNWKDYIGYLDVFVYGLVATDLGDNFDVFPAEIVLPDGREVCGIAYTDYTECYAEENELKGYVSSGFISGIGDDGITAEEFDTGLTIENLEVPDESFTYLMTYRSKPFTSHCVVFGQYLVYGIDESGCIYYKSQPYQKGQCDEALGYLYSYDESKYLNGLPNIGTFIPLTGESLVEEIDFAAIEQEINDILAEQDKNFVAVDTEQCIAIAQEAITSYLLSLQAETFLGYDVDLLVELASELDENEFFRITEEGLVVVEVKPDVREASSLMKWLVGASTGVVFSVASLGALVAKTCPVISASFGTIAGTAVEIFMQVVIEKADVRDINWKTVALASVTGAVSGFLFPYIGAFDKFSYQAIDSLIDGALGGVERVLRTKMNGADWETASKQFGTGFAIALGLSVGVKTLFRAVGAVSSKVSSGRVKADQSGILSKLKGKISDKLSALSKKFDASVFHSEYLALKHIQGQVDVSVKALSGTIRDMDGNVLTKEELVERALKFKNGEQIGYIVKGSETRPLLKWNNTVTADFTEDAIEIINVSKIVNNRPANYGSAAEVLLEKYKANPNTIPAELRELFAQAGYEIEDVSKTTFVEVIQKSKYVFHECADMTTVMIIDRAIHEQFRHAGGYSVAKAFEISAGKYNFTKLCGIAVVGGGAY